ncbi:MAG TPA: PHB depolymerase family esterase, partial [Candidatus Elarobacter sp.]|nr:PHB depolymerase family esterase [Candidatus Elarobacter sp.]
RIRGRAMIRRPGAYYTGDTTPARAFMSSLTRFSVARALAVALLATVSGCAMFGGLPFHSRMRAISVGTQPREFILHVPSSYHADHATSLVILLHGRGARAASFERSTGMSRKADREGFIVAYPQALGSPSLWHTAVDGSPRVDDVAFIRTIIDSVSKQYAIDPARIYVAGHSNGAFMAYRIGSALSARVAAIGISAGSIGRITRTGDTLRIREPVTPVSVIAFHGKADRSVPYDGGPESDGPRRIVPTPQSVDFWVNSDGCNDQARSDTTERGNLVRDVYTGCKGGTEVVLYTIMDGTHKWPGDQTPWWKFAGSASNAVSATDAMWAFFVAHPKQSLQQRPDSARTGTAVTR